MSDTERPDIATNAYANLSNPNRSFRYAHTQDQDTLVGCRAIDMCYQRLELYEAIFSRIIKETMIPRLGPLTERNQEVLQSTVKQGLRHLIQLTVRKLEQQYGLEATGPVPASKKKPRSPMLPEPRSLLLNRKALVAGPPVNVHDSFYVSSDYHIGDTYSGNNNQVFKAQQVYFNERSSTGPETPSDQSTDLASMSPIGNATASDIDITRSIYNASPNHGMDTNPSSPLAVGVGPDMPNSNDASEYYVSSLHPADSTNRDHDINDDSYEESDIATEVATDDESEGDVDVEEAIKRPGKRLQGELFSGRWVMEVDILNFSWPN